MNKMLGVHIARYRRNINRISSYDSDESLEKLVNNSQMDAYLLTSDQKKERDIYNWTLLKMFPKYDSALV